MNALVVVIVLAVILVGGLSLALSASSSAAAITRSIAEIETARAMQAQAEATQSAVSALGAVTVMDKLAGILVLALLLAMVGMVFYIYRQNTQLRLMQLAAQTNKPVRSWAPGPNAGWKRMDAPTPAPLLQPSGQDMISLAMMSMAAALARSFAAPQPPTQPPAPLPAQAPQVNQDWPSVETGPASEWDLFLS